MRKSIPLLLIAMSDIMWAKPSFAIADPGSEFRLTASVRGSLSLIKTGSAEATTSVDISNSRGAGELVDQNLRFYFNRDIQTCLKPYTDQIVAYILEEARKPAAMRTVAGRIYGPALHSHAGDNPADGPDVTSCATADVANGWHLRHQSGTPETVSVSNGDMAITQQIERADSYCVTFHMRRADKGHSAEVVGRAVATQEKMVPVQ